MSMFDSKKTLIVVYKDELLMNQLRKMVETKDDTEDKIVGTRDDSINIVSWEEKVWLQNKKAGNIQGKILFLDQIKGTEKLIPVLDLKLKEDGVKFGWAGNQAVLYADTNEILETKKYDAFLKKLSKLPVPKFLKEGKANIIKIGKLPKVDNPLKKIKVIPALKPAKNAVVKRTDAIGKAIGKAGKQINEKSEEVLRNRDVMKRQMLFYGVVMMYDNWLEQFMSM